MVFTTEQVADLLKGKLIGSLDIELNNIAPLESAVEGCISFLANQKYEPLLSTTQASAIIISEEQVIDAQSKIAFIRVKDPYSSFTQLLEFAHEAMKTVKEGVEEPSFMGEGSAVGEGIYRGAFSYVGKNVKIGDHVKIFPHVYIDDDCEIGDGTVIYSGAKIYASTKIGKHCVIHSGVVIGSDGFGFAPQPDGSYKTIPQMGNVIIEDKVDIGANTVIDCATMNSTIIREGVKLDNLVQVAHNVIIGKNSVVAAQSGISGSSKLGEQNVVAGQVGIAGHLKVGNKVMIGAKSGIAKDIADGMKIQGYPAMPLVNFQRSSIIFRQLPDLKKQLQELEEKIVALGSPK